MRHKGKSQQQGKQDEAYKNDGNENHQKIGKQYFFTYGYISISHVTTPLHVHYVGIHHEKQGKTTVLIESIESCRSVVLCMHAPGIASTADQFYTNRQSHEEWTIAVPYGTIHIDKNGGVPYEKNTASMSGVSLSGQLHRMQEGRE